MIDLDEAFTDVNGDALTYAISGPGAAYATLDGSTLTIDASTAGDFDITVIANDGTFDSDPVTFTFSAAEPPEAGASVVLYLDGLNYTRGVDDFAQGNGSSTRQSIDGEPALGDTSHKVTAGTYSQAGFSYGRQIDADTGYLLSLIHI